MGGNFAKATAVGGLPVRVAEIALPRAATRCFPDLVSGDSNGLVLISFRRRAGARMRGAEDSLGVSAFSTTYGIDNTPLRYSQCNLAGIGTRRRCGFAIEELLSPDLDQIKQGEQAA